MNLNQQTVQKIRQLKNDLTHEERLKLWQQTCQQNGLSGEFVLSAELGEDVATEEQIKWIAEMYGR
ncbi:hypothetical protein QG083_07485 [Kingella kingae]|uniref:hypothetical protein n=2 Tax=Kingella kingae TaxID=504 RepID=UPI0002586030|nr:hypothetical protein [Kingella kingae]EIC12978.1 hypothetical protein KKB_08751 [Kingella kingae PYKK081]MBD3613677.1 hypothetical protein [Kingella kingae]MBD3631984.1 hypothetical protein [Kingella kingae]MBD3659308.1 hypothetical protein [Kingella kingae]MDK4530298.1 hypothetical protein [Kingella kingae]